MRILLDENLPRKLAGHLIGHTCRTVVECGWAGKKNGELLGLADPQFDVLLTLDKNLPYQQNMDTKGIAVLIVRARSLPNSGPAPGYPRMSCGAGEHPTPAGSPRRFGAAAVRRPHGFEPITQMESNS